jgi:hypothetical protein
MLITGWDAVAAGNDWLMKEGDIARSDTGPLGVLRGVRHGS